MSFSLGFAETLAAARAGHGSALGDLFHDLHPRIYRYLRVLEPGEAEDLASDVWLDVAAALDRFEGDERGLRMLAFTIARRRMTEAQRRGSRHPSFPAEVDHWHEEPASSEADEEAMTELATEEALAQVAGLSDDQAEVLLLRVLGGLPVEDVARVLSRRPGTVRLIQDRALRKLAERSMQQEVTA